MAKYDIYCVGMRKELFMDYGPGKSSFSDEPMCNERDILFCTTAYGRRKFVIELCTLYGWCGSGYTTAAWGVFHINPVDEFGPATHLPKNRKIKIEGAIYDASKVFKEALSFDCMPEHNEYGLYEIANNLFTYSADGGDGYYPGGGSGVNEELFEELPRAFNQRPVWILYGDSGSGKSTIGHILNEDGKIVYETDSANNGQLPKEIWADVIVVGNKWDNIGLEDVIQRLPEDCKPVKIKFSM